MVKECVLYKRNCFDCGECSICDLDSNKKCNNCEKCLENANEHRTIKLVEFMKAQEENNS